MRGWPVRSLPVSGVQKNVLVWGGMGLAAVALVYVVVKYVIPKITGAAATTVANIPAQLFHAASDGADNLISEVTTPFSAWWKGLDTTAPAPINAGNLVNSGSTYYPTSTGTNAAMGGQNFGVVDGALW